MSPEFPEQQNVICLEKELRIGLQPRSRWMTEKIHG